MINIKKKISITLASCIVMFFLILLIIRLKEDNTTTFCFNGQNDYWEVKIIDTIYQDKKLIKRSVTVISKVDQPELEHLDIIVSDNTSWTCTDSMELSNGMVKGEKKISNSGTNYNEDIVTINSIKIDIILNNSEKQNIPLKKVE